MTQEISYSPAGARILTLRSRRYSRVSFDRFDGCFDATRDQMLAVEKAADKWRARCADAQVTAQWIGGTHRRVWELVVPSGCEAEAVDDLLGVETPEEVAFRKSLTRERIVAMQRWWGCRQGSDPYQLDAFLAYLATEGES